jgi:hypothetical protein
MAKAVQRLLLIDREQDAPASCDIAQTHRPSMPHLVRRAKPTRGAPTSKVLTRGRGADRALSPGAFPESLVPIRRAVRWSALCVAAGEQRAVQRTEQRLDPPSQPMFDTIVLGPHTLTRLCEYLIPRLERALAIAHRARTRVLTWRALSALRNTRTLQATAASPCAERPVQLGSFDVEEWGQRARRRAALALTSGLYRKQRALWHKALVRWASAVRAMRLVAQKAFSSWTMYVLQMRYRGCVLDQLLSWLEQRRGARGQQQQLRVFRVWCKHVQEDKHKREKQHAFNLFGEGIRRQRWERMAATRKALKTWIRAYRLREAHAKAQTRAFTTLQQRAWARLRHFFKLRVLIRFQSTANRVLSRIAFSMWSNSSSNVEAVSSVEGQESGMIHDVYQASVVPENDNLAAETTAKPRRMPKTCRCVQCFRKRNRRDDRGASTLKGPSMSSEEVILVKRSHCSLGEHLALRVESARNLTNSFSTYACKRQSDEHGTHQHTSSNKQEAMRLRDAKADTEIIKLRNGSRRSARHLPLQHTRTTP